MMSVDSSRRLWNARIDPRTGNYAIDLYPRAGSVGHPLGPAHCLEPATGRCRHRGLLLQRLMPINRLAVDTHGYTDVAMGLAKLLGFSLCARLAALRERKLYVTSGQYVPKPLRAVAVHIPLKSLHTHWDELLRLAASVREGWCSASQVLDRMGSAAQGDPLYQAAVTFGRLVRTQYLCDYFFRNLRFGIPFAAHSTTANQFISCSERFALMRPDPSVAEVATSNGQSRVLSRCSRTWSWSGIPAKSRSWRISRRIVGAVYRWRTLPLSARSRRRTSTSGVCCISRWRSSPIRFSRRQFRFPLRLNGRGLARATVTFCIIVPAPPTAKSTSEYKCSTTLLGGRNSSACGSINKAKCPVCVQRITKET
jgi:hypothetical protein